MSEKRKLKSKDIVGYLPHGLMAKDVRGGVALLRGYDEWACGGVGAAFFGAGIVELCWLVPILHPLEHLGKPIKHKGEVIVPIVELAKIIFPHGVWGVRDNKHSEISAMVEWGDWRFGYSCDGFFLRGDNNNFPHDVENQVALFDKMDEWKIDYRGLIDDGLAVSVCDVKGVAYGVGG